MIRGNHDMGGAEKLIPVGSSGRMERLNKFL